MSKIKNKKHISGYVQFTRKCNQECIFCSAPPHDKDLTTEETKQKILEVMETGATEVMFTGGEPTLREDLPELIKFAFDQGLEEVSIQTNGSRLYDVNYLKTLTKQGNIKFDISFHSYDKKIFSKLSKTPENYSKLLKGLKNVNDLKIPAYFTIVINSLNYKSLKEHVEFIYNKYPHFTHFCFNFVDPSNRAAKNIWIVPKLSEVEPYLYKTLEFMKKNGLTFRVEYVPLCYLQGYEEYCSEVRRKVFEEPSYYSFLSAPKDKYKSPNKPIARANNYIKAKQCETCTLNSICPGLNHRYIQIYETQELFPVFYDLQKIIKKIKKY